MLKLWTNAGKEQAFSNPTRQFTDVEIADLTRDMTGGSEKNAWIMLKDVPKETVMLANPMNAT
eukprot:5767284-Karenia_brevis.AAC.1